ncbi:MAG: hypothetical protein RL318_2494 [Fibrobacterota bacterium]|jgi:phosphinothricin acetyltransferase
MRTGIPTMMIRNAQEADIPALVRIYNQAILEGLRTGDTEPVDQVERAAWLREHDVLHPVLVAELQGIVVGYVSLSSYRKGRAALQRTAEISYYVDQEHRRSGVASALLQAAFDFSEGHDLRTLIAIVIAANTASIALLERFGFTLWGTLPDVVEYGEKTLDHLYFGRRIEGA